MTVEWKIESLCFNGYQPLDTFSKYGEGKYSHDDRLCNDQLCRSRRLFVCLLFF